MTITISIKYVGQIQHRHLEQWKIKEAKIDLGKINQIYWKTKVCASVGRRIKK